jgi:hypothetical protein
LWVERLHVADVRAEVELLSRRLHLSELPLVRSPSVQARVPLLNTG